MYIYILKTHYAVEGRGTIIQNILYKSIIYYLANHF